MSLYQIAYRYLPHIFWVQFILTGVYGSFIPYTFTGFTYRFIGSFLAGMWMLTAVKEKDWGRGFKCWPCLAYLLLTLSQSVSYFYAETLSFTIDFIEGRFWSVLLVFVLIDLKVREGFDKSLSKYWFLIVGMTFIYGCYQITIGLPELRESISGIGNNLEMSVMESRFSIRLNSSEMFGTYIYSNLLGIFFSISLISTVFINSSHLYKLCLVLICTIGAYLTGSNGCWFALGLASFAVLAIWAYCYKRLYLIAVLGSGLLVALFLWPIVKPYISESIFVRWGYMKSAFEILKAHPFGIGTLNFSEYYFTYMSEDATEVKLAHNDHLQVLTEVGIPSFIFYLCFYGSLVFHVIKNFKNGSKVESSTEKNLIFPELFVFLYLLIFCGVLKMGPMDLEKYQEIFFIFLGLWMFYVFKSSTVWRPNSWALLLIVIYFGIHSSIDFPFYDHSLMTIFMVIVLGFSCKVKTDGMRFKPFRPIMILFILAALYISNQRFQVIYPWADATFMKMDYEGIKKFYQYCQQNPQQLKLWENCLKTIEKNRNEFSNSKEILRIYNHCLDELIRLRPRSAGLHLIKAKQLGLSESAGAYYLKAISLYPLQPKYKYAYGMYLNSMEKKDQAKIWLSQAIDRQVYVEKMSKEHWDFNLILLKPEEKKKATRILLE